MRRVDTVDGGWVDVRERQDLTFRQHNLLQAGFMAAQRAMIKLAAGAEPDLPMSGADLSFEEATAVGALNEVAIVVLVADWSYDCPVPRTPGEAAALPADVGRAAAAAISDLGAKVIDELAKPTDFEPGPDIPGSPTGPSRASAGSVRAEKASGSTKSRKKS